MTDPSAPSAPPPPPSAAPIGGASSVGYGCLGFIGFYVAAAFVAGAIGAGSDSAAGAVIVLLGLVAIGAWGVSSLRRASAHAKAIAVRVAIGFLVALLVFGGCIVMISNANFH